MAKGTNEAAARKREDESPSGPDLWAKLDLYTALLYSESASPVRDEALFIIEALMIELAGRSPLLVHVDAASVRAAKAALLGGQAGKGKDVRGRIRMVAELLKLSDADETPDTVRALLARRVDRAFASLGDDAIARVLARYRAPKHDAVRREIDAVTSLMVEARALGAEAHAAADSKARRRVRQRVVLALTEVKPSK